MSKVVNIPDIPPGTPSEMVPFFRAVSDALSLLQGLGRTDDADRAMRLGEIQKLGILLPVFRGATIEKPATQTPSGRTPKAPTDFDVETGGFAHRVTLTIPDDDVIQYIEIWSAINSQNRSEALRRYVYTPMLSDYGNSVELLISVQDSTQDQAYWCRSVSFAGNKSAWNPSASVGGVIVPGAEAVSVTIDSIIELLRGGSHDIYSPGTIYGWNSSCQDNDGRVWKYINQNPSAGNAPPNPIYWERSGILMVGDVDGEQTVAIDGNLVVDQTILARHIKAASITADKMSMIQAFVGMTIQSSNFVEGVSGWKIDKDGVLKIEASGGKISVGNSVNGDYVELDDGDITFYIWNGTSHLLYKTLTRNPSGVAANGAVVEIPGIFLDMPTVMVSPSTLDVYDPAYAGVKQTIECYPQDLEEYDPSTGLAEVGTKYWRFTARAILTGAAGTLSASTPNINSSITGQNFQYVTFWTPWATSSWQTTPLTCVGITSSGNVGASIIVWNYLYPWTIYVEVTIEVRDADTLVIVGTYTLLATSTSGSGFTGGFSPNFSAITNSFPVNQYDYRYHARAGLYWIGTGADVTVSCGVSNVSSVFTLNSGSQAPAGSLNWLATGT